MTNSKQTFLASQMSHVRNSLYSLAKARLISQDAVEAFLVEINQPVNTYLLIFS